MEHTQSRLNHFKDAVYKRYGIILTAEDIQDIYRQIESKEAVKLRDLLAQKEEWEVRVDNPLRQSIKVVYHPKIRLLITALPCTVFNHKQINAKRNRQNHA
jgi:hypothetical protein